MMCRRRLLIRRRASAAVLAFSIGWATALGAAAPDAREEFVEHVRYLASDELGGRAVGTPGIDKARDYIAREFKEYGLTPGGDGGTYFQRLDVSTGARPVEPSGFSLGASPPLRLSTDWAVLGVSGSGKIEGEVVFAGYGITAQENGYDDYAGLDVEDKIVLVLRYEPPPANDQSPFRRLPAYSRYATLRFKAENARAHGAKGMILVDLHSREADAEELIPAVHGPNRTARGFIAVQARKRVVEQWLAGAAVLQSAKERLDRKEKPALLNFGGRTAAIQVTLEKLTVKAHNVVGFVPGSDPKRNNESIVLGAHYDHIGTGYVGLRAAADEGKIHNGADDNASGAAVLLGLARRLSELHQKLPLTVVFVAFTAEELGLHGSRYYVNHPAFALNETRAMINFDMVGRMRSNRLSVLGVETAKEFRVWIDETMKRLGLQMGGDHRMPNELSDHFPFYEENIPYLAFFTGMHEDYHRPTDDWEKLNFDGMGRVCDAALNLVRRIMEDGPLTFVAPRPRPGDR